jgi:hypothetical protein
MAQSRASKTKQLGIVPPDFSDNFSGRPLVRKVSSWFPLRGRAIPRLLVNIKKATTLARSPRPEDNLVTVGSIPAKNEVEVTTLRG